MHRPEEYCCLFVCGSDGKTKAAMLMMEETTDHLKLIDDMFPVLDLLSQVIKVKGMIVLCGE